MTTSTTMVEYIAASDVAKEAIWLSLLAFTFQQADSNSAQIVYSNSKGTITLSKNPVHYNASKHIEVQYHFAQNSVTKGKHALEKVSIVANVVDAMTKSLFADRFWSIW